MATTSENGSSLTDRLMTRSRRASRIGTRKGLFERFGLESPYEGGSVGRANTQQGMFAYLSSRAYFDELRGLSAMRRHLIWRISAVRQRLRVGEGLRTAIATSSVRAAMFGYNPIFVDWSTQLDLEEAGIEEQDETGVAVAAARRMRRPKRRQTAAERALRAQITRSSDVLANLETLASASVVQRRSIREEADSVARMPRRRQATAARRLTQKLKGTAAIAARGTDLGSATLLGDRPMAVAQGRDSFLEPKGLRRVMSESPLLMELERPEPSVAPEVEPQVAVQTAARRPMARKRAQREVPVASVAREVRTQSATGRAGPPAETRPQRRVRPVTISRPTERIARSARLEQTTPLTDTRRGLRAAFRSPILADEPSHTLERRVAARAEAGLPDQAGRLLNSTGYVHEARIAARPDSAVVHPEMATLSAAPAPSPQDDEEVGPPVQPVRAASRRTSTRGRTHRTPSSQTEISRTHRTPASVEARRSPALGSVAAVRGPLPPLARAVHRAVPAPVAASRVALARPPVTAAVGVDRRQVGLSPRLSDSVARETHQRAELGASVAPARAVPTRPPAVTRSRIEASDTSTASSEAAAGGESSRSPEMAVALPAVPTLESLSETESSQRALVSTGPSRRSRALPTVRAASRALVQERLGVRGRLLSPSSTAHLQVTEPEAALADGPVRTGVSRLDNRLGGSAAASAGQAPSLVMATIERRAEEAITEPAAVAVSAPPVARRSAPSTRPTRNRAVQASRLGSLARAAQRDESHTRLGASGELTAPRVITPFRDVSPSGALARAQAVLDAGASVSKPSVAAVDAPLASRVFGRRDSEKHGAPVSRSVEGRAQVGTSPAELVLALPERVQELQSEVGQTEVAARPGLASRATRRGPARTSRRSVVPDPTPESARSHDRHTRAAVGTSQPVRTDAGRIVTSKMLRTEVTATERSLAWRTPRSFVARTVLARTPESQTVASEGFRTESRAVERSRSFKTSTGAGSRARSSVSDPTSSVEAPTFLAPGLEEFDAEGGVARASRRMDAKREGIADSAMSWLDQAPAHVPGSEVSQTSRALGRSTRRREAGSLVPHPVGSSATDRATTRMLAGPERVYAQSERMLLDSGDAIPESSLRSVPRRPGRKASGESPLAGLTDGMTLARPAPTAAPVEQTSIAGGVRAVSPRPGAPSRARLDRALRAAAAVRASDRAESTVLTLPAPIRQLEQESAPREFQARVSIDDQGRVVRASVEDVLSGASLALPPRAGSAAWAEDRQDRSVVSSDRSSRSRQGSRAGRDEAGVFVPSMRALEVDAPEAGPSTWASLESTLGTLAVPGSSAAPVSQSAKPLVRRRAWNRRAMAAELGLMTPALAGADYVPAEEVPEDSPSWARRAVKGTGTSARREGASGLEAPEAISAEPQPARSPNTLMGALARTERPEDLIQVILDRGRDTASIRNELPAEAVRIVETIVGLDPEEAAFLRSGRRVMQAPQMSGPSTRSSRSRHSAPSLHQLSGAQDGVGANKIMKLADKLMGLIHLAESGRQGEARDQVRMAEDSNEARSEGGIQAPGMSVEDMEMNIEALQKNVLNSVMEYFEELDSRREDPDGRNKWW